MLRILHIGLGPLGQRIISDYYSRGVAEVIGAIDVSPALAGKPLSSIAAGAPRSVKVLSSLSDFKAWKKVDAVVVTTASDLRKCADTFRNVIMHGLPIVTTCEEAVWPWLRHEALSNQLDKLCRKHGARLLGTGVNPGYLMDTVPVFATAVSKSVTSLKIHRIQDATTRRIPFQKKIGATLDAAAFKAGIKAGWLRHVGLGESLHFVANAMGWTIDRWNETINPVIATKAMKCGLGPIKKGNACGVVQTAAGYAGVKKVLEFTFQAAIGQADPHDRVIVEGEPKLDLKFQGGVHGDVATSSITINAITPLIGAQPGLHTMATIPMVRWLPGQNG